MRIPSRHIAKEESKKEPPIIERVIDTRDDSAKVVAEIKKVLEVKKKPPKYVFSMLRDSNGILTEVVATPVDFDTII
jgi:hypothetical protein